ncbi:hypothetical protein LQZ19_05210 [Treponema primitia]|uniref:hypothetical protein n=1 Tax=Treponema primitia TaxID=88058 RepID=UPI00397FEA6F
MSEKLPHDYDLIKELEETIAICVNSGIDTFDLRKKYYEAVESLRGIFAELDKRCTDGGLSLKELRYQYFREQEALEWYAKLQREGRLPFVRYGGPKTAPGNPDRG